KSQYHSIGRDNGRIQSILSVFLGAHRLLRCVKRAERHDGESTGRNRPQALTKPRAALRKTNEASRFRLNLIVPSPFKIDGSCKVGIAQEQLPLHASLRLAPARELPFNDGPGF